MRALIDASRRRAHVRAPVALSQNKGGNDQYLYYYATSQAIVTSMEEALAKLGGGAGAGASA